VALIESKAISVRLAEIIAYLHQKEHVAAFATFPEMNEQCKFLGTVLKLLHDALGNSGTQQPKTHGEKQQMTDSTLKTVLVLDTETQWFKPVAHNLSASQAVDLVTELSTEGKTVKTIDQGNRHRSSDAAKCKPCKAAALLLTDESAAPDAQVPAQE
jgi:hypothetical protein